MPRLIFLSFCLVLLFPLISLAGPTLIFDYHLLHSITPTVKLARHFQVFHSLDWEASVAPEEISGEINPQAIVRQVVLHSDESITVAGEQPIFKIKGGKLKGIDRLMAHFNNIKDYNEVVKTNPILMIDNSEINIDLLIREVGNGDAVHFVSQNYEGFALRQTEELLREFLKNETFVKKFLEVLSYSDAYPLVSLISAKLINGRQIEVRVRVGIPPKALSTNESPPAPLDIFVNFSSLAQYNRLQPVEYFQLAPVEAGSPKTVMIDLAGIFVRPSRSSCGEVFQ